MQAILLAVAAGLCWGIGELCTKAVLHGHRIGPLTAIAIRSTVALPVIWLAWYAATQWFAFEARPQWREVPTGDVLKLVLGSGLVAGALAMICFYAALALDDITKIKPIAFTIAPATAALLGWLLLGETMTWRRALAIVLILAGVFVLTGDRPSAKVAPTSEAPAGK